MGVSSDAILFWGFSAEDEGECLWTGEDEDASEDWQDRYVYRVAGLEPPDEEFPESQDTEEGKAIVAKYHRYWENKRKLAKKSGCEVSAHCSSDYPIDYVCIADSIRRAYRGYPATVESLEVGPSWETQLREFCEVMDIPWQEPTWLLASYLG